MSVNWIRSWRKSHVFCHLMYPIIKCHVIVLPKKQYNLPYSANTIIKTCFLEQVTPIQQPTSECRHQHRRCYCHHCPIYSPTHNNIKNNIFEARSELMSYRKKKFKETKIWTQIKANGFGKQKLVENINSKTSKNKPKYT